MKHFQIKVETNVKNWFTQKRVTLLGITAIVSIFLAFTYPMIIDQVLYDKYELNVHSCDVELRYNKLTQVIDVQYDVVCANIKFDKDYEKTAFNGIVYSLSKILEKDYQEGTNHFAESILKHGYVKGKLIVNSNIGGNV